MVVRNLVMNWVVIGIFSGFSVSFVCPPPWLNIYRICCEGFRGRSIKNREGKVAAQSEIHE